MSKSDEALTPMLVKDLDLANGKILYNLSEGRIIPSSEENTDKWDVAFDRVSILANNKGQMILKDFDAVEIAPQDNYLTGESGSGVEIEDGQGKSWYHYNPDTHAVSAVDGRTFIVMTSQGTYAKLQILSYYKQEDPEKGAPRFLTFRYAHQDNQTSSLASIPDTTIPIKLRQDSISQ